MENSNLFDLTDEDRKNLAEAIAETASFFEKLRNDRLLSGKIEIYPDKVFIPLTKAINERVSEGLLTWCQENIRKDYNSYRIGKKYLFFGQYGFFVSYDYDYDLI